MNGAEAATVHQMRTEVRAYWDSAEPVFAWTPNQKTALSHSFLQQRVLPRRNAVLALAEQVARWNFSNLRHEQRRLATRQERLHSFLDRMTTGALLLGLLVALLTTARVWILERRSRRQLEHIEGAERELRRLSRSLVRAQEQERKSLSRELHDVVGQMLTAMGMELGNLGSLRAAPEKFRDHLEGVKSLNSETLRTVRDLAMGLRPSMLDDLGLGAALNWQGREFSRRSGVPVSVQIDGELDDIPEAQRTCIFRVVQEALTNCARHARAKSIRVSVYGGPGTVTLTVQDDGIGFDPYDRAARGLGLLGIEERVREEGGVVRVDSEPARGTILRVDVPLRQGVPA